jgi:hypothetical protein
VSIEVLAAPPKRQISRDRNGAAYITRCSTCDGPAYALGGGSLWCLRCLQPFVDAGERYVREVVAA